MNAVSSKAFAACIREDLRRLLFHLRGLIRSLFQK